MKQVLLELREVDLSKNDAGIRESLCHELRAAGYDTMAAEDGRAGLAAFRVHLPELLLTDLAMPDRTQAWARHYRQEGLAVVTLNAPEQYELGSDPTSEPL